jgi:hypothetical protein
MRSPRSKVSIRLHGKSFLSSQFVHRLNPHSMRNATGHASYRVKADRSSWPFPAIKGRILLVNPMQLANLQRLAVPANGFLRQVFPALRPEELQSNGAARLVRERDTGGVARQPAATPKLQARSKLTIGRDIRYQWRLELSSNWARLYGLVVPTARS